ncbi:MAG: glycerol dehydrogenase [Pseudonocardiales bacterium]|jgi:glycerol dehydrogenase|nr:glycerol dehydrogenase [Pseudonocardiales bacterium]
MTPAQVERPGVYAGPGRYVQGRGVLDTLGELVRPHGTRPLVVMDEPVRALIGERVEAALAGLRPQFALLRTEITYAAVDELVAAAAGADVAVGVGGGKVLDAAKGVALRLGLPVVTVPTVASNDSPASGAIAMYDDGHSMVSVDRLPRHPEVVLVDTDVIVRAPVAFLRAGIGDAISKRFEADACRTATGVAPVGGRPLRVAGAIAEECFRTLSAYGEAALAACGSGQVTAEFDAVVEAVILMSGLGFENGGLSLAHALTRGLMSARGASSVPHGLHVAWGLLVQLAAEGRSDVEVLEVVSLLRRLGLPTRLGELSLPDAAPEEIEAIARLTMTAPHVANMPVPMDESAIVVAVRRVEALAVRSSA